jgi:hypothetical protein
MPQTPKAQKMPMSLPARARKGGAPRRQEPRGQPLGSPRVALYPSTVPGRVSSLTCGWCCWALKGLVVQPLPSCNEKIEAWRGRGVCMVCVPGTGEQSMVLQLQQGGDRLPRPLPALLRACSLTSAAGLSTRKVFCFFVFLLLGGSPT